MQRGITVFIALVVLLSWLMGLAVYFLQDSLGQFSGLIMLLMLVIPIIAAWIAHRVSGAAGHPFRGLVWGGGGWIVGVWLLGLLAGLVVVAVSLGLRLQEVDLKMTDYVAMVVAQQEEAGQTMPESARGFLSIGGWITLGASPLIGVWFMAAMFCLGTFPWFGWLGRRLLVRGAASTGWTLAALFFITGIIGGVIDNPMWADVSLPIRMLLTGISSAAVLPAMLWLFLRTRSAVIPAMAQAAYMAILQGTFPILTASALSWLAPPQGLLVSVGALFAGIALWIWKDPGGKELAVAAVAHDGTPLTPEMLAHLEAEEHAHAATPGSEALAAEPVTPDG